MAYSISIDSNTFVSPYQQPLHTPLLNPEKNNLSDEINQYKAQIGDKFEYSSVNTPTTPVFRASDGKYYNLKNILEERLSLVNQKIHQERIAEQNENWFKKAINWCKNTFNIGYNSNQAGKEFEETVKIVSINTFDIKTSFKDLTGEEYSAANIDKLLSGEIKLKAEKYCEKYTNQNLAVEELAAPVFDENWQATTMPEQPVKLSKSEQEKYETLKNSLDDEYKNKLETALNSGKLLINNSDDNTSVLDNLHKIFTTPRQEGIDNINILRECLDILQNPCIITQGAEDIPLDYQKEAIDILTNNSKNKNKRAKAKEEIEYRFLSTCAASSLEYDLATNNPAEFFRLVEGLTSQNSEITKTISTTNNDLTAQLDLYKVPYEKKDNKIIITLKSGENTEFLNKIQNNNKDEGERSIIDITMQSMIMNLGSRQTYNALSDKRAPNEFTSDNGGLISAEIEFAKNILSNRPSNISTYMQLDNNGYIIENKIELKKRDIYKALSENKNIIIGYCFTDDNTNQITGGHEITIIGYSKYFAGIGFFVCQDSDDNVSNPICMSEDFLIKNIHHMQV